jgi:hypothetical protein
MTALTYVSQREMEKRTGFGKALGYAFPDEDEILIRKGLPDEVEREVKKHEEEHILKGEEGPGLFSFIGDIFASKKQADSAKDATQAQIDASKREIEFQRESRDLARGDAAPYREAGATALDALMSMTGLKGTGGGQALRGGGGVRPGRPTGRYISGPGQKGVRGRRSSYARYGGGPMMRDRTMYNINEMGPENVYSGGGVTRNSNPATVDGQTGYVQPNENPGGVEGGYNFMTDPGYNFRFNEGQRALETGAAARGGLLSGGFAKKMARYGQDYASNEYTNVYNRISNIAGLGQVSAGQSGNYAMMAGQGMANAAGNAGYARASGYTAGGNIWGNALQSGGQYLDDVNWGNIFGRKSSGGDRPGGFSEDKWGF